MDESYCAFCGVCFGIFPGLYQDRLEDEDVAWTEYFRARRYLLLAVKRADSSDRRIVRKRSYTINSHSITNWFLSGVGKGITREGRAPPTIYDARYLNEDEDDLDTGDRVVAYKGWYVVAVCPFPLSGSQANPQARFYQRHRRRGCFPRTPHLLGPLPSKPRFARWADCV